MDVARIAVESVRTLWAHKHLWFFGFFVAGGAGGSYVGDGGGDAPAWLWVAVAAAVALAACALFLHVVSESALIDGVRRLRVGEVHAVGRGFRTGLRFFAPILTVKLLAITAGLVCVGLAAAPAVLGATGVIPLWLGLGLTVLLLLPAVPLLLTVYFVYEYALRFVVLESRGAMDALAASRRFVRGRIAGSLKLLVVDAIGQVAAGLVGGVAALVALAIGFVVYLAAGLVPALIVGGSLLLPVAVAVAGARGTFRSSLWTIGWLDERADLL